ncbi:gluconate:H+ symporter [Helicobacter sp. faydin-H20]|uniref:GntT/GntP/DsdX family permease n=1 Tax=Helicobacter anatolicus TaxID=2905874 RepID=UPI001E4C38BF|nr:gluconate:H+ symporter [Helicobacter anatolicus]MCE3037194.1 gluconate:H+ symporter [Helicobacter anatolicus]
MSNNMMLIGILILGILFIIFAITRLKLHAFLALSLASIFVGMLAGIPLDKIGSILENGVGGTLGFLAIIIGCGAILGKILEISGGALVIANSLLKLLGPKRADIAMMFVGFFAGIAVFVEVGFVLLAPLIFVVAKEMKISYIKIGIALATSLMCVHCLVPPHPAATSVVQKLDADMAQVIMWSIFIGLIAAFFGSIFYLRAFSFKETEVESFGHTFEDSKKLPSVFATYFCVLLPLFLMFSKVIFNNTFVSFISNPIVALLIGVMVSCYLLGVLQGFNMGDLLIKSGDSFREIAGVLLIIGAGGAFNEVLIASDIGEALKQVLKTSELNPIFLAWLIAIILHVSVGSATVAMISAAGIIGTLDTGVSKEVLCLAIGSGAIGLTIVTDSLFWLVKETLRLDMKDMFKYFTGATTIASVVGLGLSFVLSKFI